MNITPIKTQRDYRRVLKEIEGLMAAKRNTSEGDRLDVLVTLVEAWERKHPAYSIATEIRDCECPLRGRQAMSSGIDISALYREFTNALTEVLAENAVGPARRGKLARAHAAVKKHPNYSEHAYFLAVETAFTQWEAMQNAGR